MILAGNRAGAAGAAAYGEHDSHRKPKGLPGAGCAVLGCAPHAPLWSPLGLWRGPRRFVLVLVPIWLDPISKVETDQTLPLSRVFRTDTSVPRRQWSGGRLILNLLLVRHGVPPAILYQRDRAKYLRALRRADEGENGPLGEVVARSVRHSIERHVLPALAGPLRLVPLGSLATADVSRLALLSAERRNRLRAVRMSDAYCSTRQWGEEYKSSR